MAVVETALVANVAADVAVVKILSIGVAAFWAAVDALLAASFAASPLDWILFD